jgi:phosphohistidine phosphatase
MDVILIRHAEAGDRDPVTYPDDTLRPVSPAGERKMASVARAMKAMGIRFDHLVTSPLVRAAQTAAILRGVFERNEPAEVSDALGLECTPSGIVQLLSRYPVEDCVALVGHEPAFSVVAAAMIGPSGDARIALKKGGCVGIGFDGTALLGTGTLQFHLKPGQLKKLKH